ncbi:MAG: DUF2235 domain-containing protein [Holophagaceae bacterium]|nr:DUF2235 domain-containing protein [Holophagaceae bacterium]
MPKRLVICSDGTWNKPDQSTGGVPTPTNVVKLSRAVAPQDQAGTEQRVYYHDGVGARGGWWKRFTGGAFGEGIDAIIQANYRFLIDNYDPGDELFLFGFSRGAYLVRSTVGLVRNCGLLKREHGGQLDAAYALYRRRDEASSPRAEEAAAFRAAYAWEPRIRFIGVWDTVGSLGIPLRPLRFWTKEFYEFHDVKLSTWVDYAFQALAVDERRKPFAPTLWQGQPGAGAQILEQAWFPGAHSNIGGGYVDHGLSDLALLWLAEKARACGLDLDMPPGILPDALGGIQDSMTFWYRMLGENVRQISPGSDGQFIAPSVRARQLGTADYRPPNVPWPPQ